MRKTPAIPANSEPQTIIIISRLSSRQTAIKALVRTLFPVTPVLSSENLPDANQVLRSRAGSRVLAVIDGWSLEDSAISANDLLPDHDSAQPGFPETRCLYLVNHSKEINIRETDRVLGGDITSNQFIDTIRDMFE